MRWYLIYPAIITLILGCETTPPPHKQLWTDEERTLLIEGLEASKADILDTVVEVPVDRWMFRSDSTKWSIGDVVEHLVLQDRAYHREIKVVAALPAMPQYVDQVKGNDELFLAYATDPVRSKADWDVTPTGRFCTKEAALNEFIKVRNEIINLITTSNADFRQVFTFRKIPKQVVDKNPDFYKPREVRDLHQLVLNAIGHTQRHLNQIRRIKSEF